VSGNGMELSSRGKTRYPHRFAREGSTHPIDLLALQTTLMYLCSSWRAIRIVASGQNGITLSSTPNPKGGRNLCASAYRRMTEQSMVIKGVNAGRGQLCQEIDRS
jgi:hypothetical protein